MEIIKLYGDSTNISMSFNIQGFDFIIDALLLNLWLTAWEPEDLLLRSLNAQRDNDTGSTGRDHPR